MATALALPQVDGGPPSPSRGRAGTTTTDAERNVLKMELNRKISVAHRPRQLSTGKMTEQIKANRETEERIFQEEVIGWLSEVLAETVTLKDIRNGVALCRLVRMTVPDNHIYTIHENNPGIFFANDNVAAFWGECKRLGVKQASEVLRPADITGSTKEMLPRLLLTAVLSFARIVHERYNVKPPNIVKLEMEIEQLRRQLLADETRRRRDTAAMYDNLKGAMESDGPYQLYKAIASDPVDVAVGKVVDEIAAKYQIYFRPQRLDKGEYIFGPVFATQAVPPAVYVRLLRDAPFVFARNGEWQELSAHLQQSVIDAVTRGPDTDRSQVAEVAGADSKGAAGSVAAVQVEKSTVVDPASYTATAANGLWTPSFASTAGGDPTINTATVISPAELLTLARKVVEPLALPAFELGYRWYRNSGGLRKHKLAAEQNVSYATYKQQALARQSAGASSSPFEDGVLDDLRQIDLDVTQGRTSGKLFKNEKLRNFTSALEAKDSTIQTRVASILKAGVERNPHTGYVQGLNEVALVLCGFMPEEPAFWTMAAMVEDCHISDFLSRAPPPLLGYQATTAAMAQLSDKLFPELRSKLGDGLQMLCSLASSRTWFDVFIDSVPFDTSIAIMDHFFRCDAAAPDSVGIGGEFALVRASLAVFDVLETRARVFGFNSAPKSTTSPTPRSAAIEAKELYPEFIILAADLNGEVIASSLVNSSKFFTREELLTMIDEHRKRLLSSFDRLQSQFSLLAKNTDHPTKEQVVALYDASRGKKMITKAEFAEMLTKCGIRFTEDALRWLFGLYSNKDGTADVRELLTCLALLSPGTVRDRLRLCFDVWDAERRGMLLPAQINDITNALVKMLREGQVIRAGDDDSKALVPVDPARNMVIPFDTDKALVSFDDFQHYITSQAALMQLLLPPASRAGLLTSGPKIELLEGTDRLMLTAGDGQKLIENIPGAPERSAGYCSCYGNRTKAPANGQKKEEESSCIIS